MVAVTATDLELTVRGSQQPYSSASAVVQGLASWPVLPSGKVPDTGQKSIKCWLSPSQVERKALATQHQCFM